MKNKFTVQEQIDHLKSDHKIEFKKISETEAVQWLTDKNYFFKLKAYAGVFDKHPGPIDFHYLIELSKLDMYLRRIVLVMTLNLEHSLRCLIVKESTINDADDGYLIAKRFLTYYDGKLHNNERVRRPNYVNTVKMNVKSYSSLFNLDPSTGELTEELSVWELVEVLSLKPLIDFYNFYRKSNPNNETKLEFFYGFSVKKLRNSAAHSNCLLHNLKYSVDIKGYNKFKVDNSLSTFLHNKLMPNANAMGIHIAQEELTLISIPLVHDIVALILMYNELIKSKKLRDHDLSSLKGFVSERALRESDFFSSVVPLYGSLNLISKIIDFVQSP